MSDKWRLLGSIEAVNGILMFGISTATFYAIIRRIFRNRIQKMINSNIKDDSELKNLKNFFIKNQKH